MTRVANLVSLGTMAELETVRVDAAAGALWSYAGGKPPAGAG
jgi:hypothetical protein